MGKARFTPSLRIQMQRASGDCCIASLATLTGIAYEDVLIEAAKERKVPHNIGLFFTDLLRVAERLKYPMRKKARVNFFKDKGILDARLFHNMPHASNHAVILMAGLIFDQSDGSVWIPDEFRKRYQAKFGMILVPVLKKNE
jgi:hypothetical protein